MLQRLRCWSTSPGKALPAYLWSTLKAPGHRSSKSAATAPRARQAAFPTATPLSPRSEARSPPASSATGSTIPTISAARRDPSARAASRLARGEGARLLVRECARDLPRVPPAGIGMACSASPSRRRGSRCARSERHRRRRERACRAALRAAGYEVLAAEPIFAFPGCPHGGDWVLMVKPLPAAG